MPSGGNALAELGGRVTKQVQSLVAATAAPGWPEPASDPLKPLLNGLLTVIGLAAVSSSCGVPASITAGASIQSRT